MHFEVNVVLDANHKRFLGKKGPARPCAEKILESLWNYNRIFSVAPHYNFGQLPSASDSMKLVTTENFSGHPSHFILSMMRRGGYCTELFLGNVLATRYGLSFRSSTSPELWNALFSDSSCRMRRSTTVWYKMCSKAKLALWVVTRSLKSQSSATDWIPNRSSSERVAPLFSSRIYKAYNVEIRIQFSTGINFVTFVRQARMLSSGTSSTVRVNGVSLSVVCVVKYSHAAKLSPMKPIPQWIAAWAINFPTILNTPVRSKRESVDGRKWSCCPSNNGIPFTLSWRRAISPFQKYSRVRAPISAPAVKTKKLGII